MKWLVLPVAVALFIPPAAAYWAGFSALAWIGLAAFALTHVYAIAYGKYKNTPLGFAIGRWVGSDRNLYDRFVHAAFGLTASPVLYEGAGRLGLSGQAQLWTPFVIVMAVSALFEIFEWAAHLSGLSDFGPELQGDIWDSQKDMLAALCGALVFVVIRAI